jgi:hypothetical protein
MVQADSALRGDFCTLVLDEAEMSSPYPNMRQRDILQKLMRHISDWHQRAKECSATWSASVG